MTTTQITAESARAYAKARAAHAAPKASKPFVGMPVATVETAVANPSMILLVAS